MKWNVDVITKGSTLKKKIKKCCVLGELLHLCGHGCSEQLSLTYLLNISVNKNISDFLPWHIDQFDRHKQFVNSYILYFGGNMKDFTRDR